MTRNIRTLIRQKGEHYAGYGLAALKQISTVSRGAGLLVHALEGMTHYTRHLLFEYRSKRTV